MTSGKHEFNDGDRATIQGYIHKDLKSTLKEIAKTDGIEMSDLVRKMAVEYAKYHYHGNAAFKLDPFIENPEFQAVPALSSDNEIWSRYYKDSNQEDRTKLRINIIRLKNLFQNIDFNEEIEKKKGLRVSKGE